MRLGCFAHNPERESAPREFFIWIRCNPLKSPDSAKENQGNASFFPWISLVFLGFIWREIAFRLHLPAPGAARRRPLSYGRGVGVRFMPSALTLIRRANARHPLPEGGSASGRERRLDQFDPVAHAVWQHLVVEVI